MVVDSVTFRIEGEVPVDLLAEAIDRFNKVLHELSRGRSANVRWIIAGLEHGSATTTARAIPLDDSSVQAVPALVDDYLDAGRRVARGERDAARPILRLVEDLVSIADEDHPVVLETAEDDISFLGLAPAAPGAGPPSDTRSLGTVRGRVETLSHRRGLRFTLYDLTTDRPVSCYLRDDDESIMRDAWGRIADVTGTVTRDGSTGRPQAVRRVTQVEVVAEGDALGYQEARGVLRLSEPAEQVIRRVRDAG